MQGCCLGLALDAIHWAFLIVLVVDHPEREYSRGAGDGVPFVLLVDLKVRKGCPDYAFVYKKCKQ